MDKFYTVSKNKSRSWQWLRSWTLIEKFKIKLKKAGKTTKPLRYGLKKFPYNCTVEVTNRFKGLDLIECLKNYGQRFATLYGRWWPKPSLRKREIQEGKMVVWGGLINSWEKKRGKRQRRKGKYIPIWMQISKEEQGEIRKTSSVINVKR